MSSYRFKFADTDREIEQIHRLNYAAFVEEIPQHAPNPDRRLVDQFHAENTYVIGLTDSEAADGARGEEVVAMLALRSQRPFSLDKKLENLDAYLPPHRSMCEIRLLYIRPDHRNGKVLRGLMELVAAYAMLRGHDLALISGTTRQLRLYRHFGFEPFGPQVGRDGARFQPMFLTVGAAKRQAPWVRALQEDADAGTGLRPDDRRAAPANFLPGPVNIPPSVLAEMSRPPVSHRSPQFMADMARIQARLCKLVHAKHVALLMGSGTLANEAVAAQLARFKQRGVVLVNGEFGCRLANQARRWGLDFVRVDAAWGAAFDYVALAEQLAADPGLAWLWCVHSETSTGMLNDLAQLTAICAAQDVRLCVDCISSIGVAPVDLSGVFLATGASGKALGSVAGLALVFSNRPIDADPLRVPSYLDLGQYRDADGVPFTIPTSLVYALDAALDYFGDYAPTRTIAGMQRLRLELTAAGLDILVPADVASPAVTTIVLPQSVSSLAVGDELAAAGFMVSYRSRYLVERNWLQVCLMGEFDAEALSDLTQALIRLVAGVVQS